MMQQIDPAGSRFRRASILLMVLVAGIAAYVILEKGEHGMNSNVFASTPKPSKPLIDTVVPKQIAIATFSMG